MILKAAPGASESVKFHALCYHHAGAPFGAIGGNICMIEVRNGRVRLSFIHGASLSDRHSLLRGSGRAKRWVGIDSEQLAADRRIAGLVRSAAPQARRRGRRA